MQPQKTNAAFHLKERSGAVAKTVGCVCVCVQGGGGDERSRVEPDGKKKTTLGGSNSPLNEGNSLINMQPCPMPGPAGLEGECYPGLRSLHPAQKSHLQAVLGANTWRKNTPFVRMQRFSDVE